ncbi:hypothetical protein MLD38_017767 [Melastoma candidum]|uniref:Uncharacterized protein n=1 Tax=Melastoma candidum TaxID=119954 RepID=A0ACB9QRV9_9MYRT|nr:hypothetical protein MLD38_017767 [Melastoma candidum]
MSRLSFRPRPLDIHKKLPIVKSFKDFEDEEAPTTSGARTSQSSRFSGLDFDGGSGVAPEVPLSSTLESYQFYAIGFSCLPCALAFC